MTTRTRRTGRSLRIGAALLALALGAGACSGDDEPEAAPPDDSQSVDEGATTTAPAPIVAPLTGRPVDSQEAATRPAVVVKIDNAPQARPQSGLDLADVVYEERVEGGVVRFLAVFQSRDAELVGPIRSVRSTDPPIVWPLGGVFAFSDGTPPFVAAARELPATVLYEAAHGDAFNLRSGRQRPFKTYASTETLRSKGKNDQPPPALFTFLETGETFGAAGATAGKVELIMGERTSAAWEYDPGSSRYLRITNGTAHVVESGQRVAAENVILQFVPYRNTGYTDSSRAQVDEAVVTGTGDAMVISAGKVIQAKWSKPSREAVTAYTDAAGAPLKVRPGQTWVSFVPAGTTVTVS